MEEGFRVRMEPGDVLWSVRFAMAGERTVFGFQCPAGRTVLEDKVRCETKDTLRVKLGCLRP